MNDSETLLPAGVELPEPGTFFNQLAEKLGATAQASHVFGEAVERDGVTVIPVAQARWGVGGGGGRQGRAVRRREGMGGGGGVVVQPVGYIEMRQGETRFRPIVDPRWTIAAAIAAGVMLLFGLGRLRR